MNKLPLFAIQKLFDDVGKSDLRPHDGTSLGGCIAAKGEDRSMIIDYDMAVGCTGCIMSLFVCLVHEEKASFSTKT
jgi:hypothetical protein